MIHSFTCAGILPTQYIKLCTFAGIGRVGHGYIKKGKTVGAFLLGRDSIVHRYRTCSENTDRVGRAEGKGVEKVLLEGIKICFSVLWWRIL